LIKYVILILFQLYSIVCLGENLDSLIQRLHHISSDKGAVFLKIGDQYLEASAYDLAIENYTKSYKNYELEHNIPGMSRSLRALGVSYLSHKKEYAKAMTYFNRSLKYAKENNDTLKIAELHNDLGICYAHLGVYEKGYAYFIRSYRLKLTAGDTTSAASTINNMGELLFSQGKMDSVVDYYQRSLSLSANNSWGKAYVYHNLAKFYLAKMQYDSVSTYLVKSEQISQQHAYNDLLKLNYSLYINLYSRLNQIGNIEKYTTLYQSIVDSLINEESLETLTAIQSKYETKLKAEENKRLKAENGFFNETLSAQRFKINTLIVGLLLTILTSFVITIQYRNQKTANKLLVRKNLEIVDREKLLEKTLVEHRVQLKSENKKKTNKRHQSSISEEKKDNVYELIIAYLGTEKPYLNHNFTLQDLANKTTTNRTYVSQVINEKFDQNFTTLINQYRISEARRMLSNPENQNITIEAIANDVGFKSKSAFNRAFKQLSGITPSYYLKSIRSLRAKKCTD
jgi:AraC-like DNA-binding protein